LGKFYYRNVHRVLHQPRWGWQCATVIILLVAYWIPLGIWFPGIGFLFIAATIISLLLAVRWRSALLLIPLLLNPMSLSFGCGLHEWFNEKPQFHYKGLPGDEFYNLDPDTRCYRETGGCKVYGDEWITYSPHNAALSLMVSVFGPPKHTYHGPYPSKTEAMKLTQANSLTSPDAFLNGKVQVNGREIAIGQDKAKKIIGDFGIYLFELDSNDVVRNVRAAIFREHCLVIRVSSKERMPTGLFENESEGIVLFDLDSLHPIARYVLSGYAQRIPRLLND
jgi:hypothetical protein